MVCKNKAVIALIFALKADVWIKTFLLPNLLLLGGMQNHQLCFPIYPNTVRGHLRIQNGWDRGHRAGAVQVAGAETSGWSSAIAPISCDCNIG